MCRVLGTGSSVLGVRKGNTIDCRTGAPRLQTILSVSNFRWNNTGGRWVFDELVPNSKRRVHDISENRRRRPIEMMRRQYPAQYWYRNPLYPQRSTAESLYTWVLGLPVYIRVSTTHGQLAADEQVLNLLWWELQVNVRQVETHTRTLRSDLTSVTFAL